jgi:hypothetical protein
MIISFLAVVRLDTIYPITKKNAKAGLKNIAVLSERGGVLVLVSERWSTTFSGIRNISLSPYIFSLDSYAVSGCCNDSMLL